MKNKIVILFIFSAFSINALSQLASVKLSLRPAGSFEAKTKEIVGEVLVKGNQVMAKNIVVNLKSLKTGIELRDEHTLKHLEVNKFPTATLISGQGNSGKGTGKVRIRGIEKEVAGTFEIKGGKLIADFPIKLADFKITGIRYMNIGVKDDASIHIELPIKK